MRAKALSTQLGSSGVRTAQTIFSAGVGCGRSPGLNSSSWIFSPGRRPTTSIAMSTSGSKPASRIMLAARSTIFTGSPISSTKTSPPVASSPERMMSCTASGIVMK